MVSFPDDDRKDDGDDAPPSSERIDAECGSRSRSETKRTRLLMTDAQRQTLDEVPRCREYLKKFETMGTTKCLPHGLEVEAANERDILRLRHYLERKLGALWSESEIKEIMETRDR